MVSLRGHVVGCCGASRAVSSGLDSYYAACENVLVTLSWRLVRRAWEVLAQSNPRRATVTFDGE